MQAIQWKYQGVLYTAQLNLHTESKKEVRAAMIELAKSAVRLGPVMRDSHFFENHGGPLASRTPAGGGRTAGRNPRH